MKVVFFVIISWLIRICFLASLFLYCIFIFANKCGDEYGEWHENRDLNGQYFIFALMFNVVLFICAMLEMRSNKLKYTFLLISSLCLVFGVIYRFYIPC